MVSPFLPDAEKIAAVRAALPATEAGIYLNTGSLGPLPAETHRAMAELADWELRVGRSSPDYFLDHLQRMDEARAGVAAIVVASTESIALTHSTTDGMNIATWAVDWRAGDRAVTSRFEHAGALGPLYTLRDRLGVDLVLADLGDGGDDERTLRVLDAAIVPGTKLVSLSHVAWTTGAVLPIARIVELAHARGALVAVDGAQAAGAMPVDVGALGADFYAIPAQKWLLGPEGMAALHVAPAVLDRARRTFSGYFSYASHDLEGNAVLHPDARRFEASGYHRPSVVGMARSLGWLSMYVGLDWVHRRGAALARLAADRLAEIPGVELLTPRHQMANLVTFRIAGWDVDVALEEISRRTFAIFRTIPALAALRISVGFFNTEAEIGRFAGAVELLASHTPASLPPRRTLAMLDEGGS
jgi:L-cysteine/cystine lyase